MFACPAAKRLRGGEAPGTWTGPSPRRSRALWLHPPRPRQDLIVSRGLRDSDSGSPPTGRGLGRRGGEGVGGGGRGGEREAFSAVV